MSRELLSESVPSQHVEQYLKEAAFELTHPVRKLKTTSGNVKRTLIRECPKSACRAVP